MYVLAQSAAALHKVGRIMASFKFLEKVYEHKVGQMWGLRHNFLFSYTALIPHGEHALRIMTMSRMTLSQSAGLNTAEMWQVSMLIMLVCMGLMCRHKIIQDPYR